MGDKNAEVGDVQFGSVVGKWDVKGVNKNGEFLVDMCAERSAFGKCLFSAKHDPQVHME